MIKLYISTFILLLLLTSCSSNTCKHLSTTEISKGLYLERYQTLNLGVWGEMNDCYLTDSTSFRTKIGYYDEHESFKAVQNGETIEAFNFQSNLLNDTIERKTISQKELYQIHHSDKNCLVTKPLFGINSLKCDTDFYPASSYKTEQGIYHAEIQFKCGGDYKNAIFYTDSLKFCIFVGLYEPGSFENNYSCNKISSDSFEFYRINNINKVDTVKRQTFALSDLKKSKLFKVCK